MGRPDVSVVAQEYQGSRSRQVTPLSLQRVKCQSVLLRDPDQ